MWTPRSKTDTVGQTNRPKLSFRKSIKIDPLRAIFPQLGGVQNKVSYTSFPVFCFIQKKSISAKPDSTHPPSPPSTAVFLHDQLTEKGRQLVQKSYKNKPSWTSKAHAKKRKKEARISLSPEEVVQNQQNQRIENLVPQRNSLGRTVNAASVPPDLTETQVSWRVQEFQRHERVWFVGQLEQYLANSALELPTGPFLSKFRANTLSYSTPGNRNRTYCKRIYTWPKLFRADHCSCSTHGGTED